MTRLLDRPYNPALGPSGSTELDDLVIDLLVRDKVRRAQTALHIDNLGRSSLCP
jgi:hypothetical protein